MQCMPPPLKHAALNPNPLPALVELRSRARATAPLSGVHRGPPPPPHDISPVIFHSMNHSAAVNGHSTRFIGNGSWKFCVNWK